MGDSGTNRRGFLQGGSLAAAGLLAGSMARQSNGQEPEQHAGHDKTAGDYSREQPSTGGPVGSDTYLGKLVPGRRAPSDEPLLVETPDLVKLPWEIKAGAKEFHLHARHTRREFLPDQWFDVWGYNDSMPGPTIEVLQGDRVRVVVHDELPEPTTVHWHGLEIPCRMDGVHGMTQDPILPGETYVYEFDVHQAGTFFYHSHGPMQESLGMVGLFIIHPREPFNPLVDRDFALIVQEFAVLPQSSVPNTSSMEFNFFTINGRSGPYATPMLVRLGERIRIRFLNFSVIDHHPMHLHGHTFWVTGTEGGRIPETAWIPANNVLVGVAQVREIEFIANNPGDWAIHCHMFHHMMNHMVSMVGPMANHQGHGMPAGQSMNAGMAMIEQGGALSKELGPSLGRGMGEQTGSDRAIRNGAMTDDRTKDPGYQTPGYPQDMMGMHGMLSEAEQQKVNKLETRGMRDQWYAGIQGLHTVLRVLPDDLYQQVTSGDGDIPPGASVPGPDGGNQPGDHKHKEMP